MTSWIRRIVGIRRPNLIVTSLGLIRHAQIVDSCLTSATRSNGLTCTKHERLTSWARARVVCLLDLSTRATAHAANHRRLSRADTCARHFLAQLGYASIVRPRSMRRRTLAASSRNRVHKRILGRASRANDRLALTRHSIPLCIRGTHARAPRRLEAPTRTLAHCARPSQLTRAHAARRASIPHASTCALAHSIGIGHSIMSTHARI